MNTLDPRNLFGVHNCHSIFGTQSPHFNNNMSSVVVDLIFIFASGLELGELSSTVESIQLGLTLKPKPNPKP